MIMLPAAGGSLAAQQEAAADSAVPKPKAAPADVESIDAIMAAIYDVISGPAGEVRDWDRMRSLFIDGARLIPTGKRRDGTGAHRMWTVEEYIRTAGPRLEEDGFFEQEVGRSVDQFGNIAQVFSSYDSRHTAEDPEPFVRGINSMQLWNDGSRWWFVTIFWQSETADTPIPDKYLTK